MALQSNSELHEFHLFIQEQIGQGAALTPEESVQAFRRRQEELARLRDELRGPAERFLRGEGREIDYEQIKDDVVQRLSVQGIRD